MQPPPTSWAIPCNEKVVELDTMSTHIRRRWNPRQSYRVIVNDRDNRRTFSLAATRAFKDTALSRITN